MGRHYNRTKKHDYSYLAGNQHAKQDRQEDGAVPEATADRLAKDYGVGASTIERAGKFAAAVETLRAVDELRRLGEMLAETKDERAKGSAGPGRGKAGAPAGPAFDDAPTLADLGLTDRLPRRPGRMASGAGTLRHLAAFGPLGPDLRRSCRVATGRLLAGDPLYSHGYT